MISLTGNSGGGQNQEAKTEPKAEPPAASATPSNLNNEIKMPKLMLNKLSKEAEAMMAKSVKGFQAKTQDKLKLEEQV